MMMKEIMEGVVSPPVEERAVVADSILRGQCTRDPDRDSKWVQVALRRPAGPRSGEVRLVPGERVFAKVCRRFEA